MLDLIFKFSLISNELIKALLMHCISLNTHSESSIFIGTAVSIFIDFWDKLRGQTSIRQD